MTRTTLLGLIIAASHAAFTQSIGDEPRSHTSNDAPTGSQPQAEEADPTHMTDSTRTGMAQLEKDMEDAKNGDFDKQYRFSLAYLPNGEIAKTRAEFVEWLTIGAEQGHAGAQLKLSVLLEESSPDKALHWLMQAVEQGDAAALYNLGMLYTEGKLVQKDFREAVKYLTLAGNKEDTDAQFNLGQIYYHGIGLEVNYDDAFAWYKRAADNGVAEAMYQVGNCYHLGQGVATDKDEAYRWFLESGRNGHEVGAAILAEDYMRKDRQDFAKALAYARLSEHLQYENVDQDMLKYLPDLMTQEQMDESDRLYQKLLERFGEKNR